jgi:hypothetical protein
MASADLFIRAGDTTPAFTDTILDSSGNAYNLAGKTVTFTLRSLQASAAVSLAGSVTVVNAATGQVSFGWGANDTANAGAGLFNAEWRVTTDGYTFPNDGYRTISIEQPLSTAPQQLVSVSDVREYLNFPSTDRTQDAKIMRFIKAVRPVVEAITGPILLQTFEEWHDGGQHFIRVRRRPSTGYGTTPVFNLIACSEFRGPIEYTLAIVQDPAHGTIYSVMQDTKGNVYRRSPGGGVIAFPAMPRSVHVWYQAGQSAIPENVYEGTLELIRINFQKTQQASRAFAYSNQDTAVDMPGVPTGFFVPGRVRELLAPTKRPPVVA